MKLIMKLVIEDEQDELCASKIIQNAKQRKYKVTRKDNVVKIVKSKGANDEQSNCNG